MGEKLREGDHLPFFRYDTPYSAQNRLRDLLRDQAPLFLVFMSNFGHPVTRTFAGRYAATRSLLRGAGFAMVVRSRADKLAAGIGPDSLPYPLMCDADGVLYERFAIPERRSTLMTYSLEGWRIVSAAKKQGYRPPKDTPEQLPLTLILDGDGTVLFCHYGTSLTDVPTDCAAMQSILETLELDHEVPPALSDAAPSLRRRIGLEKIGEAEDEEYQDVDQNEDEYEESDEEEEVDDAGESAYPLEEEDPDDDARFREAARNAIRRTTVPPDTEHTILSLFAQDED